MSETNTTNDLISVIIPAYNVEAYIERLLDSLKDQTYSNFEAIIIDDGSTDGTVCEIIKSIDGDTRFHLIRKSNAGVSSARNTGLECAQGKYIYFCDADDWLKPIALEKLVHCAKNCDVVISPALFYSENGSFAKQKICIKGNIEILQAYGPVAAGFDGYIFNYFFKSAAIRNARFDESLSVMEDSEFVSRVCNRELAYGVNNCPVYFYRCQRPGSALNSMGVTDYIQLKRVRISLVQRCLDYPHSTSLEMNALSCCFGVLRRTAENKRLFEAEACTLSSYPFLRKYVLRSGFRGILVAVASIMPRFARAIFLLLKAIHSEKDTRGN